MQYILGALALIVFALIAVYILFPRNLFQLVRNALRRRGGMIEKSVKVDDIVWPYLEGGPVDGEVMVLVHGFGGDKDNWAIYSAEITDKYRLIAPDLPGFGDNVRDPERDYQIGTQAARLRDFLDALGIDKVHLGGNSMGGYIALRFAIDFPERLHTLTLFNNAGVVGTHESPLQIAAADGKNPLEIKSADDVSRMFAYITHEPKKIPGQFRKIIYQDFAAHRELLDRIFWELVSDNINNSLNDQLDKVKAPTLIIWGRHDQLIDVSCVAVLEQGIANAQSVIFEDVGHVPMIEKPKATAKHQLEFLANQ